MAVCQDFALPSCCALATSPKIDILSALMLNTLILSLFIFTDNTLLK